MSSEKDSSKEYLMQLHEKHISHIIASLLLMGFFVFVGGYYWGKKSANEMLNNHTESESLTDQIKHACYVDLVDNLENAEEESESSEGAGSDNLDVDNARMQGSEKYIKESVLLPQAQSAVDNILNQDGKISPSDNSKSDYNVQFQEEYAAHLAGFGTQQAAQQCVDNYKKQGYSVSISERSGKTSKGKVRRWYQVVTPWYQSKDELERLLPGLKKVGRLKDVTLVARDKK